MDRQQEGIVLECLDQGMAKVKTSRHNDCENCGACPGNSAIVLQARNPLKARPGQRVLVEVKEVQMLKAAFVVYVLPLFLSLAGIILGAILAGYLGMGDQWLTVGGGLLFFMVAVMYIKYFDASARKDTAKQPIIIKIISYS